MAANPEWQLFQDQGHPLAPLGQASPLGLGLPPLGRPLGPPLLATLPQDPLSWPLHPCHPSGPAHSLSTQEQARFCHLALR